MMFTTAEIKKTMANLPKSWADNFRNNTDFRKSFGNSLGLINVKSSGESIEKLCPRPENILNFMRFCPIENVKMVLIGQDPYCYNDQAHGLSFSVPAGATIPKSLNNVFTALVNSGQMRYKPSSGDLTKIAQQGVLLINSSLTTMETRVGEHADAWRPFVMRILRMLPEHTPLILLGNEAKLMCRDFLNPKFEWGHPSAKCVFNNKLSDPRHFAHCKAFAEANDYLIRRGEAPINWNVLLSDDDVHLAASTSEAVAEKIGNVAECIHVFTDGAASKNGGINCRASWAFAAYTGDFTLLHEDKGEVLMTDEGVKPSNNRGELTAIKRAFDWILHNHSGVDVCIVSDSKYSINCITDYAPKWLRAGDTSKLNLDLIFPIYDQYKNNMGRVRFRHVNSHMAAPQDKRGIQYYLWRGNNHVDELASSVIR